MPKNATATVSLTFSLQASIPVPMYRQLYEGVRKAILTGQLRPGTRLQSTRELAIELGVSRNTVMNAFEQLLAEGYLEGQVGSGTFVSHSLPDEMLFVGAKKASTPLVTKKGRTLSQFGTTLSSTFNASPFHNRGPERPFRQGTPAFDEFPNKLWLSLLAKHWRNPPSELLGYGDPAGYAPLRDAIADYLRASRGVQCEAEQIIIVSGAQQALDLAARLLLNPGDVAWIEDPGYLGARSALIGADAYLVAVPINDEGLDVTEGERQAPNAKLVYVSPSHQYPLGITMTLARRLALLEWASRVGAWIIEDDYESEYRYTGRPLAALQGLDKEGRVIYIGTFSKVLFPALRIGYLVVPPDVLEPFIRGRSLLSRFTPSIDQAVLTDFLNEGHFTRHLRRMRMLYVERQEILLDALQRELKGLLEASKHETGMHLIGWLAEGLTDKKAETEAFNQGVFAQALSSFRLNFHHPPGLLLGYAGYNERQIRTGVRKLAIALHNLRHRASR
jgi:GntR family transcriptional regulator / MocR family aminotransferase